MFTVGDVVMYRRDLCKVDDLVTSEINKELCYVLSPIEDTGTRTRIQVPISNKAGHMRSLITREEIDELIRKVPEIEPLKSRNSNLKSVYTHMMNSGSFEDLIRLIKTTYLKNEKRKATKKTIGNVDEIFLQEAEKVLYNEIGYVLEKDFEETKQFVIGEIVKQMG